ncbi:MAG: type II secretion system F family protein [Actinomycetota bacterium]
MSAVLAVSYVAAAALFVAGLRRRADPRIRSRLEHVAGHGSVTDALARIGRRVRMPATRARIVERQRAAGLPPSVDRVLGAKVAVAAAGLVVGLTAAPGGSGAAAPVAVVLAAAGWRLPEFVLARRVAARRATISAAVPDLLDLVAVSVTAGLTPRLALDRAVEALHGPLAEELSAARREVELGASWRATLRSVAGRTGLRDLRRLASTLERSERLGTPVAGRLRDLAREVRAERRAAQEERARRAPVAMLFPLVFLILPAFVLAAVVPAVLVATRGM